MNNEKSIINNETDYSNKLATIEKITELISICDNIYTQFTDITQKEEEKNKQFKEEYKEYTYKKHWGTKFEISIRNKSYNTITCDNLNTFKTAINDGNLKEVDALTIYLNLDFKRGKGLDLEEHENEFKITFKPYDIKLLRKSNHNDQDINQIENVLKDTISKFPESNTIFCDKN